MLKISRQCNIRRYLQIYKNDVDPITYQKVDDLTNDIDDDIDTRIDYIDRIKMLMLSYKKDIKNSYEKNYGQKIL